MRMEAALVKLAEAAKSNANADKLARAFRLAIERVASSTPEGEQALKLVKTDLVKDLLRGELNIAVRVAKGPRARRGSKKGKENIPKDPLASLRVPDDEDEAVAKKPRGRRKVAEPT